MLIRIALLLVFSAFAVFLSVDLLLALAMPALPIIMTKLGLAILLTGFSLLLCSGIYFVVKRLIGNVCAYFSAAQRWQRRLWFAQHQQLRLKQLFYWRSRQIHYFNEIKRKRLLNADNQVQIRALANAIDKDLLAIKPQLSQPFYEHLKKQNAHHKTRQNIDALLKLQQKIAAIPIYDHS